MTKMSELSKFITIIRPSFMAFCEDACRAATFNHLLFRLAGKSKNQSKEKIQSGEVLWYASTEQLASEMSDAWGACKVRQEINALVTSKLIGKCSNPTMRVDRTKHFFFGKEQCATFIDLCEKHAICVVHLDVPAEVLHLIYSSNANDKSIKCTCEKPEANDESIGCKSLIHRMHPMDLSDASDESIDSVTKKDLRYTTKKRKEEGKAKPIPTSSKKTEDIPSFPPSVSQLKTKTVLPLSQGTQEVVDEWYSLYLSPVELNADELLLAEKYQHSLHLWADRLGISLADVLKSIGQYAKSTDTYYAKKGFRFWDIPKVMQGWQDVNEAELEAKARFAAGLPAMLPITSRMTRQSQALHDDLRAQERRALAPENAGKIMTPEKIEEIRAKLKARKEQGNV